MKKLMAGLLAAVCFSPLYSVHAQQGDPQAGSQKNALCVGCHGIKGYHTGFPEVYRVPMLSGQSAGYIVSALNDYKTGARKHPSMGTTALSLTAQDAADLAAYYESTGLTTETPAKPIDGAAGAALVEKGGCIACHGAGLAKPIAPNYPKVAGQHADYVYAALRAYKTENKPQIGRNNPIMGGVVKQFSDKELKEIARYVESLPTTMQTIQPNRFR
ncbi:cytochrome c [Limnohabitans sp. MORI2]|jgi:cytochrome c553|uniref:c-type cytochrome n=1 Tax=Limnohabitans sp. MORI2 TaxID=1751150 RepID=UPI0023776CB0|nr:c-type cytochrome [Limnohabitans sp. MORI2]BDU58124.1 cytochrome c [Limnohabitans sp. MORI2]